MSDPADDLNVLASKRGRWRLMHPVRGWQDWVVVVSPEGARRSQDCVVIEDELLARVLARAAAWFLEHG